MNANTVDNEWCEELWVVVKASTGKIKSLHRFEGEAKEFLGVWGKHQHNDDGYVVRQLLWNDDGQYLPVGKEVLNLKSPPPNDCILCSKCQKSTPASTVHAVWFDERKHGMPRYLCPQCVKKGVYKKECEEPNKRKAKATFFCEYCLSNLSTAKFAGSMTLDGITFEMCKQCKECEEPNPYVLCWRCQSSILEDENPTWFGEPVCHDDYRELCAEAEYNTEGGD